METKNYKLLVKNNEVILSNKSNFSLKEIILYPIPFFILLFFISNLLVAILLSLLSVVGYFIFRLLANFYFTEFVINKKTNLFF